MRARIAGISVLAFGIAAIALTTFDAAPAADGAGPARHPWTQPGVLRISSAQLPRTLNPILDSQNTEGAINRLTNDVLVTVDPAGNFVPRLAREVPTLENGGISRDGLTITYRLRAGVKWHDGAPFTSHDVSFSYSAIMNPNNDVISRHGYDQIARVETPDPLTVVFHLKRPFAPFVSTIFGESDNVYAIVPAHLLERYPSLNDVPYNAAPIGTGPFKFQSWKRGESITFVRNDDYFLGRPSLEKIVWRPVSDSNTQMTMLRTHEIDFVFEAQLASIPLYRSIPGVSIVLQPRNAFDGLMMNVSKRPLNDLRVRRAIAYGLDKRRLAHLISFDTAQPASGDLAPSSWAFDASVKSLPYDVTRARAELAAAGYGPTTPLTLDFVTLSTADSQRDAVQIQGMLHEIGIRAEIRSQVSSLLYASAGAGGTLANGHYDLAFYAWTAGADPDNSTQLTCANRPPGGYNQARYCSPLMDSAQTKALTHYDRATRRAAYADVERTVVADIPILCIDWPRTPQIINDDLKGFDPNTVTETWDAYRWSI